MTTTQPDPTSARLRGHGQLEPSAIDALGLADQWVTVGLDGLEVCDSLEPLPVASTHVWGWGQGRLLRGRVTPDGQVVLAELIRDPEVPGSETARTVAVQHQPVALWKADADRLSPNGRTSMAKVHRALPNGCKAVVVLDDSPTTFLAPQP